MKQAILLRFDMSAGDAYTPSAAPVEEVIMTTKTAKRMKLAPGIWKNPDGSIYVLATIWPNRKKERTLPKGTSINEAQEVRLSMIKELKAVPARIVPEESSLTSIEGRPVQINTLGDTLLFLKDSLTRSGGHRKYLDRESRLTQLIKEIGHVKVYDSYRAVKLYSEKLISQGKKPGTVNRTISIAKAAIRNAYDKREGADFHRLIPENYLGGFPMYQENSIKFRNLSISEREALWQALPWPLRPLYYFSLFIPVRISEMVCIVRSRIHLDTRTIEIPSGTTKNGKGRSLIIPEEFVPYVEWMLSTPAEHLFNRGPEHNYEPIGFGVVPKDTLKTRKFAEQTAFKKALKTAKLSGYNLHKSRQEAILHLYASDQGWSLEEIRYVGGWESIEAFERYANKDLCLFIKQKVYKVDLTWKGRYAKDLIPAAKG